MEQHFDDLLRRDTYLLDLSALRDLPAIQQTGSVRLLVSETLDGVMSTEASQARDYLVCRLAGLPVSSVTERSLCDLPEHYRILDSYANMKATGQIVVIPDKTASSELERALQGLTRERATDVEVEWLVDGEGLDHWAEEARNLSYYFTEALRRFLEPALPEE